MLGRSILEDVQFIQWCAKSHSGSGVASLIYYFHRVCHHLHPLNALQSPPSTPLHPTYPHQSFPQIPPKSTNIITLYLPQKPLPRARSTTLNVARAERGPTRSLPEKVGKLSKRVDIALPGKHTRKYEFNLAIPVLSHWRLRSDGSIGSPNLLFLIGLRSDKYLVVKLSTTEVQRLSVVTALARPLPG